MNGMQREIEGSVFIFPMILRIRTVRPERLNWLNSVMPRQISVQLSSTIRLDMILRIKNHSFMKPILEVLTTYVMKQTGVKNIVFSSSATVYGSPEEMPITEECPKGQCTNPYGWTKSMMEQIMTDVQKANPDMNVILLRYFNPVGAHESGRIGEDPKGIPNNLMPYISQVAVGKLERLGVFGDDYDTPDGTGVRDYIHVVDLAKGHVKAINYIFSNPGLDVINLGTGVGYSVLDMVKAFSKACGKEIPYEIKPRRAGDIAMCYADPAKAARVLGWKAEKGLDEMCADSWRWQSQNPNGYEK